jgi:hypothetical protein
MYQKYETDDTSVIHEPTTGKWIPMDEANTDYQAYLEWLAEGNTPEVVEL